jgi:hypothetical protein
VYSAAPEGDEPAHHGLDDDDAVPGADPPGTPGSATVRRDLVTSHHLQTHPARHRPRPVISVEQHPLGVLSRGFSFAH